MIRTCVLHADGRVERDVPVTTAYKPPPGATTWVDMRDPTEEELGLLRTHWEFHPLAIEDCVHHQRRSKFERYPTHSFLVIHALNKATVDVPLDTLAFRAFIRPGLVVSVHPKGCYAIDFVWDELRAWPERFGSTSERLVHVLVDAIVDELMRLLYVYEEQVDLIEARAVDRADRTLVKDIVRTRRDLLMIRRIVLPQREVVRRFSDADDPGFSAEARVYFRDVLDHIEVIHETTTLLLESCNGALQIHNDRVNERLNQVMKYMAVVSTMLLPMTVISGAYGMNFDVIPFAHYPAGFWVAVAMMVGSALFLLVFFRLRRWI